MTNWSRPAPKFAELNDEVLFGEVWSRNDLLRITRTEIAEIITHIAFYAGWANACNEWLEPVTDKAYDLL